MNAEDRRTLSWLAAGGQPDGAASAVGRLIDDYDDLRARLLAAEQARDEAEKRGKDALDACMQVGAVLNRMAMLYPDRSLAGNVEAALAAERGRREIAVQALRRFVEAERVSDRARQAYEYFTDEIDPGCDYRSLGQDRLCNALAGCCMWADDEYDAARVGLDAALAAQAGKGNALPLPLPVG